MKAATATLQRMATELAQRLREQPGIGSGGAPAQLSMRLARVGQVSDDDSGHGEPETRDAALWKAAVAAELVPLRPRSQRTPQDLDRRLRVGAMGQGNDWSSAVEQASAAAAEAMVTRWSLVQAEPSAVVALIEQADEGKAKLAMDEAARRRISTAVAPIAAKIQIGAEVELVVEAVGALVAIGDPAAAPALIAATDRRPPAFWPPILYALAHLGGEEAQAFLFTVAQGHPNPALKAVAKEALQTLEERAKSSEESP
ncbi:MAG: hypothetical protein ACFB9M_08865 [Myxococcota bacterium]